MIKEMHGKPVKNSVRAGHVHVDDLIYFDGPLLSRYTDKQNNIWFYLWCDSESFSTNDRKAWKERWLFFLVSSDDFAAYMDKQKSLLNLLESSNGIYIMDTDYDDNKNSENMLTGIPQVVPVKSVISMVSLNEISEYAPLEDSFYDESLRMTQGNA